MALTHATPALQRFLMKLNVGTSSAANPPKFAHFGPGAGLVVGAPGVAK